MIRLLFAFVASVFLVGDLCAQSPTPSPTPEEDGDQKPEERRKRVRYWKAELPGGSYSVALGAISAVSKQEYILDGAARVVEVNVSTTGPFQPRFYYIEPVDPDAGSGVAKQAAELAEDIADVVDSGGAIWAKVVKQYPTTTHAGTIEFRVETEQQLNQLFQSLEEAWMYRESETFRPGGRDKDEEADEEEDLANEARDAAGNLTPSR